MRHKKFLIGLVFLNLFFNISFGQNTVSYDKILLRIGSHAITSNQVALMELEIAKNFPNASKQSLKKQAVKHLVSETLLDNQTQVLGIQISQTDLQTAYQNIKTNNNVDEAALEVALKARGETVADFKKGLLKQLKRQELIDSEITSNIKVSEQEIKDFYDQLPAGEKSYRTRHILRSVEPDADKTTVAEALATSQWVKEQVSAGGDFGELAQKYSQDPSAQNNSGDLGFFTAQDLVKPYAEKMAELPLNTLSDPVRTQFGFHLIEVLEVKSATKPVFEKEKANLKAHIENNKTNDRLVEYLKELKGTTEIIIQDKSFEPSLLPNY